MFMSIEQNFVISIFLKHLQYNNFHYNNKIQPTPTVAYLDFINFQSIPDNPR